MAQEDKGSLFGGFRKKEEEKKKEEIRFVRKPHLEPYMVAFKMVRIVKNTLVTPKKGQSYYEYDKSLFQPENLEYFRKMGLYPYAVNQLDNKLVFLVNETFSPFDGWQDEANTPEEKHARVSSYLSSNFKFIFPLFWDILPSSLKEIVKTEVDLEFSIVNSELYSEWFEYVLNPSLIDEYDRNKKIADSKDIGIYYHSEDGENVVAVDFLEAVLTYAVVNRATDVHFEHQGDQCVARLRIDGDLRDYPDSVPEEIYGALINVIRIRADIDVAKNLIPQDGKMEFTCSFVDADKASSSYDIRVSIIPEVGKHLNAVLRIQQHGTFKPLDKLGFTEIVYSEVKSLCEEPHGLVLVTGPTGSGKTTTLYSILNELNRGDVKLLTAEDPVEIKMQGLTQVAINEEQGRTFPTMMQHFLRHDPDIILVGEIRNVETAKLAIEAANTGHLVLSTLHTNDAVSAIKRLGSMNGIDVTDFSFCLKGVLAQRLIKTFNENIRTKVCLPMTEEQYESFIDGNRLRKIDIGKELNDIWGEDVLPLCKHYSLEADIVSYKGRTAITEFWKLGSHAQDFIFNNKFSTKELEEVATNEDGMLPMCVTGMEKVLNFQTSLSELIKVVGLDSIRKNKKIILEQFFA